MGIIAIVGIISVQVYFVYHTMSTQEKQTSQSINIALRSVAEGLSTFNESTLPDENIVHQYSLAYYIVDINDFIDPTILQHYLKSEFNKRNLELDFEYAIYDCYNDEMVYGDYVSLSEKPLKKNKITEWPKFGESVYYFGVHFPGMRNYTLEDMGIWYFFSIILIVVILFFGYSMFVIFRQRKLAEIQKDFVNNMTHEFKTPLTSLALASDVLQDEKITEEPERIKTYSRIIKEQSLRLQEQMEKVLQITASEKLSYKFKPEEINIEELLSEIILEMKLKAEAKNGFVDLSSNCNVIMIKADRFHLTGMLLNIIDNSLKYVDGPPEITITVSCDNNILNLEIQDNGIGIEAKYQKKIFKRFFRVPKGNIHDIKGFGLGLSYVKQVVKEHKWKLSLESEAEKGTRIRIIIPIKN